MSAVHGRLVLASQSPRRREILTLLGLSFEVAPADVDEAVRVGEAPRDYVSRMALEKAAATAQQIPSETKTWVLGSDTIVCQGDEILLKPEDDADAGRMIAQLSGTTHSVMTSVAVQGAHDDAGPAEVVVVETKVTFRPLSAREIDGYVASGEGRDKAGAYGIQGLGSGLVERIDGNYQAVVGLPGAAVITLLQRVGALAAWP